MVDFIGGEIGREKYDNFIVIFPKNYVKECDEIVDKYGNKIHGIFSTLVDPKLIKRAIDAKINIHWVHPLFDLQEGQKSFNNISSLSNV